MSGAQHTNLRDAHLHLAEHGEQLSAVGLADCRSIADCLARVADRAAQSEPGSWIDARGVRIESLAERRFPTADELEAVAPNNPALVVSFDHHAAAANHAALAASGISRESPNPPGGMIERDASGNLTGVLLEKAFGIIRDAIPQPTDALKRAHILTAQQDLLRLGFVEVHEMMASAHLVRLLLALEAAGDLDLRVVCYAVPEQLDECRRIFEEDSRSDRVRFGGLKLFTDGTVNSRTAHMLNPYADPIPEHPCGTPLMQRRDIDSWFGRAKLDRFDIAAHAIGDAAVRTLLDAYEQVGGRRGSGFQLRIEHAQFIDDADIPRFTELGAIASLQPCHLLTDIEAIERLTPDRAHRAFALRDLIDSAAAAGIDPADAIYLGSDSPVVPPTPTDNIQAAVHRRRDEPDCPRIAPQQAITEDEAWALMRASESQSPS